MQGVLGVWYAALNVGQHYSLKTLHNDWGEYYWPVIIHAGSWALLEEGNDGCGLEAGGNGAVAEGKVEDGCENISQFVGACSESPPRDGAPSGDETPSPSVMTAYPTSCSLPTPALSQEGIPGWS